MSLKTEIPSHCILEIDIVSFNVLSPFLKAKQMKKGKDTVTVNEVGKTEGMQSEQSFLWRHCLFLLFQSVTLWTMSKSQGDDMILVFASKCSNVIQLVS